jgi:hypothetical protein
LSRREPRRFDELESFERLDDADLRDDELGFAADCLEELGRDAGCREDELGRDAGCREDEFGRDAGCRDGVLGRDAGWRDDALGRVASSLEAEDGRVTGCLESELGLAAGCRDFKLGRATDSRDGANVLTSERAGAVDLDLGRSRNWIGSRSELRGDDRSVLRVAVLRATWPAPFLFVYVLAVVPLPERLFG